MGVWPALREQWQTELRPLHSLFSGLSLNHTGQSFFTSDPHNKPLTVCYKQFSLLAFMILVKKKELAALSGIMLPLTVFTKLAGTRLVKFRFDRYVTYGFSLA